MAFTDDELRRMFILMNCGFPPDAVEEALIQSYATQTRFCGLSDELALLATAELIGSESLTGVLTYEFYSGSPSFALNLTPYMSPEKEPEVPVALDIIDIILSSDREEVGTVYRFDSVMDLTERDLLVKHVKCDLGIVPVRPMAGYGSRYLHPHRGTPRQHTHLMPTRRRGMRGA